MKTASCLALAAGVLFCDAAAAYEYKLQFTPNAGARGLVVAGYALTATSVVGNCSYYTQSSGSGRGGGYRTHITYYNQTCTWDRYGNLVGVVQGAPAVPTPLAVNGTQTIYARDGSGGATGSDTALGGGFVNTVSAHYTWQTPGTYQVISQALHQFVVTLASDGDLPLDVQAIDATVVAGRVKAKSKTCIGSLAPGASCAIIVTYDPTRLRSATGLAYDTLTLGLLSNAGQAPDFVQGYTIQLNSTQDGDAALQ